MTEDEEITTTPGSGNVFADLDLPGAEELLGKAELARQVGAAIRERGLTPGQAAEALGLDQPGVSALLNGRLAEFSMERLVGFLLALDRDIEIAVRPKQAARAHVHVA
jgi:predicted XRE-type DNA-binding protein